MVRERDTTSYFIILHFLLQTEELRKVSIAGVVGGAISRQALLDDENIFIIRKSLKEMRTCIEDISGQGTKEAGGIKGISLCLRLSTLIIVNEF